MANLFQSSVCVSQCVTMDGLPRSLLVAAVLFLLLRETEASGLFHPDDPSDTCVTFVLSGNGTEFSMPGWFIDLVFSRFNFGIIIDSDPTESIIIFFQTKL